MKENMHLKTATIKFIFKLIKEKTWSLMFPFLNRKKFCFDSHKRCDEQFFLSFLRILKYQWFQWWINCLKLLQAHKIVSNHLWSYVRISKCCHRIYRLFNQTIWHNKRLFIIFCVTFMCFPYYVFSLYFFFNDLFLL